MGTGNGPGGPRGLLPQGPHGAGSVGGLGGRPPRSTRPGLLPSPELPARARDQVYRLGLSPRCRPAERLSADEWWVRDLADELGVSYCRFKCWVEKGYVHVRKVGGRGNLVDLGRRGGARAAGPAPGLPSPRQVEPLPGRVDPPGGPLGSGVWPQGQARPRRETRAG